MTTQGRSISGARIARLARRGVVAVGGADALKFLNDLVTADVSAAGPRQAVYAGLLTPQGKVLFDFVVFRDGDDFLFDLAASKTTDFVKRLGFYRLRAKVEIRPRPELAVHAGWDGPPLPLPGTVAPDPRLPALGWRALTQLGIEVTATEADYDTHRIALGVPEGGIDFAFGDAFPHDVDMDQLAGIDFAKGCYVGQEVVSRIEHRHIARRRAVTVTGAALAPAGTEIIAGGKPIGTLASSVNGRGIALVRLDRAKEALDKGETLTAGGAPVTIAIPGWAKFGWPAAGIVEP